MAKKHINKSERVSAKQSTSKAIAPPRIAPHRVWSLASFVADDNPAYGQLIGYLQAGATLGSAAASVRLSYATIADWLAKYREGSSNALVNKIGGDVAQAIGEASIVAEVAVKGGNPREWLRYGSRSSLDDSNPWNESAAAVAQSNQPSAVTNNVLIIGTQLQHDALAALESAGIITQRRNELSNSSTVVPADSASK